jgi:hypothetical protein
MFVIQYRPSLSFAAFCKCLPENILLFQQIPLSLQLFNAISDLRRTNIKKKARDV